MFLSLCRILFRTSFAASTLLFLCVLILWPLSYVRFDLLAYGTESGSRFGIVSYAGRLSYATWLFPPGFTHFYRPSPAAEAWNSWSYLDCSSTTGVWPKQQFLGCQYEGTPSIYFMAPTRTLSIPYAYFAFLATITPATWLLTRNRRRRKDPRAHNLCPKCAYDLRAHLPSAANSVLSTQSSALPPRCPECGTPIPST